MENKTQPGWIEVKQSRMLNKPNEKHFTQGLYSYDISGNVLEIENALSRSLKD